MGGHVKEGFLARFLGLPGRIPINGIQPGQNSHGSLSIPPLSTQG
jgi:hypothetical protein